MSKHRPKNIENNPFLEGFKFDVFYYGKNLKYVNPDNIKVDGGVITQIAKDNLEVKTFLAIDKDKYVNLFFSNGTDKLDSVILKLPSSSLQLLVYVMSKLREDDTIVEINVSEYMESTNIKSRTTFHNAKKQLILSGIIAPSSCHLQGWFWVNPKYIYRGLRTKGLKENINSNFE